MKGVKARESLDDVTDSDIHTFHPDNNTDSSSKHGKKAIPTPVNTQKLHWYMKEIFKRSIQETNS